MDRKLIIGAIVAFVFVAIMAIVVLGLAAYFKGGFSEIQFMLGKSEVDRLIEKINKYLKN